MKKRLFLASLAILLLLAAGSLYATTAEVNFPPLKNGDLIFQTSTSSQSSAIFVATGAKANIAYFFEHRGSLELDGGHYKTQEVRDESLAPVATIKYCKAPNFGAFTSYNDNGKHVSFIGDTHPTFNGSVVKAAGIRVE